MGQRDLHQLGHLIRTHRAHRGMTLRDVEKATGITTSTVSRIEQGEIDKPSALHLSRLAQAFGMEVEDYYALAGYMTPVGLPEMKPYLRVKYGLSDHEAERVEEIFQALRGRWGADN